MKAATILALAMVVLMTRAAMCEPILTHTDVFVAGQDGYAIFRIPSVVMTADGSLLAFAEARKFGEPDPGSAKQEIHLVMKRSVDAGRTWSSMKIIEAPGELWSAGNPATVVDRDNGRVWLFYIRCKPKRGAKTSRPGTDDMQNLARWSDDQGVTWSEPIDLTHASRDFNDATWKATIMGPGGAIQTRTGRLIVPAWKTLPYGLLAIYSDDHGKTWQRGELMPGTSGGGEDQLVELTDGKLMLDSRQTKGPTRMQSISSDGGRTWSDPKPGQRVSDVECAIKRLTEKSAGEDRDRIIWTGPKGPDRKTLVVRVSYDEGQSFTHERVISDEAAAYSDLTILKDKTVGVLWERGGYKYLTFTRFNREFLEPAPQEAQPRK